MPIGGREGAEIADVRVAAHLHVQPSRRPLRQVERHQCRRTAKKPNGDAAMRPILIGNRAFNRCWLTRASISSAWGRLAAGSQSPCAVRPITFRRPRPWSFRSRIVGIGNRRPFSDTEPTFGNWERILARLGRLPPITLRQSRRPSGATSFGHDRRQNTCRAKVQTPIRAVRCGQTTSRTT